MCGMLWERGRSFGVGFFPSLVRPVLTVVPGLLRACELLEPEYLVHMLKAVKHLSMNATLLDVLQNANALEILIRLLDEQISGPYSAVCTTFDLRIHGLTCFSGNLQPYLPNMLQPVSIEQVKTGGSGAGWNYTKSQTSDRVNLAA
jgi:hypothetical protein